ncbi:hypothetical protein A9264_05610 [Vibrio sp. UCD-FRSSP16_10]|uniref:hypothetical protein n=1 Tax=unclassified Vibrio TaxID=2614977 RepID=UPI0007FC2FA1|nr:MULTISPECIES: hypothetical protein [unclassified Vibrio]OBT07945.1 hypothetical protein A9260_07850 [Vibrio sp. UCD-FRSSP16_30]OBT17120.1 hypothetical protein A9264_05610 [Vibrio sp. UCD-FRSSP16_10]
MRKQFLRATSLSGSLIYFLFGLALVTTISTYQGYSSLVNQTSFFANSSKWLASILFLWGLLLIFCTSARCTIRAIWALVIIIAALGIGQFIGSHSEHTFSDDSSIPMIVLPHAPQVKAPIVLPQPTDLSQSYQQAVMESGWYSILDISRLQNDKNLVESYAILKDTRTAILKHLLQTQQKLYEFEQELYEHEANAHIEDNYIDSKIVHCKQQNAMWKEELLVLNEVNSIIQMLDANRDGWTIQDGAITFYSNVDTLQFEDILTRIQTISEHQKMLSDSANKLL